MENRNSSKNSLLRYDTSVLIIGLLLACSVLFVMKSNSMVSNFNPQKVVRLNDTFKVVDMDESSRPLAVAAIDNNTKNAVAFPWQQQRKGRFEDKANTLLKQYDKKGLQHPPPFNQVHYKASKFELSPGHSSSFEFSVVRNVPNKSTAELLSPARFYNFSDSIICNISHKMQVHFPHFSQEAFPCWSMLQRFPKAKRYIQVNKKVEKNKWIQGMLKSFQSSGITIMYNGDDQGESWWNVKVTEKYASWPVQHDNYQFEVFNNVYFLNQTDVESLQKRVLGDDFIMNDSWDMPLRVMLVAREGTTRQWIHINETAFQIKKIWGDDVEVMILPNPEGSLKNQALPFHKADIIVSPHGAQLTNLAFIRPCTSVLELFPTSYYLGYFQPYVLSAGGISFDGYPFDRNHLYDTKDTPGSYAIRVKARSKPCRASPESIVRAFPRLVLSALSCRRLHDY